MKKIVVFLGVCLLLVSSLDAHAQADAITVPNSGRIHIGDIGALEAGAMIARTNDGAASWYNPAGLVRAFRPSVSGNASLYEMNKVTIGSGNEAEDNTTFNIVPTYLGSVGFFDNEQSSHKAAWGFSITTPVAWKSTASDEKESGTAGIDLSYTRYSSSSELKSLVPTLAVAYALSDDLSVGMAAHLHYTTEYAEYSDYARNDDFNYLSSSVFVQDSQSLQGQLTLGASWRPVESVNIGIIARSPSLNLYDNTKATYNYLAYYNDTVDSDYASNQNLDYRVKKPAEAGIGIAIEQPNYSLEADAIYRMKVNAYDQYNGNLMVNNINFDALGNITTSQDLLTPGNLEEKEVLNCRVGGHVVLSDTIKLHLGAYTDKSTMKNSDAYQKVDLYGVTTGLSYTDKNSSIGAGLSYSWSGDMKTEIFDENIGDYVLKNAEIQAIGFILSGKYYF